MIRHLPRTLLLSVCALALLAAAGAEPPTGGAAASPPASGADPGERLPVTDLGMVLARDGADCVVSGVEPEGLAFRHGVRAGDRVVAVDGVDVAGSTLDQVRARLLAARLDAIRLLVRRPGGGQQELRVRRPEPERAVAERPGPRLEDYPLERTRRGRRERPSVPGPQSEGRSAVIQMARVAVGDEFIDFTLPRLGGGEITLSQLKGKPIFLDFWATWCGPCVAEVPALAEIHRRFGDQVHMLGVSLDETASAAMSFARRFDVRYPLVMTQGWHDPVVRDYGIHRTGIPFNILIGKDGRIAAMDLHGEPLARALEGLVRGD